MMHSRGLVLFLLYLASGARRSTRVSDSHQETQQQNSIFANGLEASVEWQEAFTPGGLFRRAAERDMVHNTPMASMFKHPRPSISELLRKQVAKPGRTSRPSMRARRGTAPGGQAIKLILGSRGGEFVDTTECERMFLQFSEGEEVVGDIMDALEGAVILPGSPQGLQEELPGYFVARFSWGPGAESPLLGPGLTSAGHFLRFAPIDSKEPSLQRIEVLRDAASGRMQVATLNGGYSTLDGKELWGDIMSSRPSVRETYDALARDGEFQPSFAPGSVSRSWSCTFFGERLLFARVHPGGGMVVYERRSEAEVMAELQQLLEASRLGQLEIGEIMERLKQVIPSAGSGDRLPTGLE